MLTDNDGRGPSHDFRLNWKLWRPKKSLYHTSLVTLVNPGYNRWRWFNHA